LCARFRAGGEPWRKLGQIIARGQNTWLVRIYQGREPQTGTRKYVNQTIHGAFREAQRFLNLKLQQREPWTIRVLDRIAFFAKEEECRS
jgi:hypothetical protein